MPGGLVEPACIYSRSVFTKLQKLRGVDDGGRKKAQTTFGFLEGRSACQEVTGRLVRCCRVGVYTEGKNRMVSSRGAIAQVVSNILIFCLKLTRLCKVRFTYTWVLLEVVPKVPKCRERVRTTYIRWYFARVYLQLTTRHT